jgi:hypothetical protein
LAALAERPEGFRLVTAGRGLRSAPGRASARCAASFFGTKPSSFEVTGSGRQTTSSLPMICTGAHPRAAQRASIIGRRTSRSSPRILILIN